MSDRAALMGGGGLQMPIAGSTPMPGKLSSRASQMALSVGNSSRSTTRVFRRLETEDTEEGMSLLDEQEMLRESDEAMQHEPEPLDETTYGFGISSLVRDSIWLVNNNSEASAIRVGRLCVSIALILLTSGLQTYVLYQVARLLCGKAVEDMRHTYSEYERHMYPNNTEMTMSGHVRGLPGHLVPERFRSIDEQLREDICNIPLAHPCFLSTVLLIWTLVCLKDVRKIVKHGVKLIWVTPRVDSLRSLFGSDKGKEDEVKVEGLTLGLKVAIFAIIFIRFCTVWILLWVGCRWLTATIGLDEMFLNGCALEFVLLLQELLYEVLVPHRHQLATQKTMILPLSWPGKETAGCYSYFGSLIWAAVAVAYVLLYVFHLQSVLPDYRWDVRDICNNAMPKPDIF